jgi:hypothetical protein
MSFDAEEVIDSNDCEMDALLGTSKPPVRRSCRKQARAARYVDLRRRNLGYPHPDLPCLLPRLKRFPLQRPKTRQPAAARSTSPSDTSLSLTDGMRCGAIATRRVKLKPTKCS